MGGSGGSGGDGRSSNHRDTLSNLGSSESYWEEPLSHLPGVGVERLPQEDWGELRSVFRSVPHWPPEFRDRGEERDPGQIMYTASLCRFARDAVTLAFPYHRVPACSMAAILHSARSRIPSVMGVTGHQGIVWATCP